VKARILFGAVFAAAVIASPALAQTTLRVGLAEDPDNLDPTTAGSYVGRIVLASLCDKLFDIDGDLNSPGRSHSLALASLHKSYNAQ